MVLQGDPIKILAGELIEHAELKRNPLISIVMSMEVVFAYMSVEDRKKLVILLVQAINSIGDTVFEDEEDLKQHRVSYYKETSRKFREEIDSLE